MALKIVFSEDALETLISTTSFIENRWGAGQVDKFLKRLFKVLALASENPYMYKAFMHSNDTRVALISKQTSFIYRIREDEILILFFWDNRQDSIFTD